MAGQVLQDERLAENADRLGELLRRELRQLAADSNGVVGLVRGKGLLNAMVINVSRPPAVPLRPGCACAAFDAIRGGAIRQQRAKKPTLLSFVANGSQERPGVSAWDLCLELKDRGLLAKPTQRNVIRFAPPLVISEAEVRECVDIIRAAVKSMAAKA